MKPLDEDARATLRAGMGAEAPSKSDRDRVRRKLEAAVAAGLAGPAIAAPTSAGAAKGWGAKLAIGGGAGAVAIAVVVGALTLRSAAPQAPVTPASGPEVVVVQAPLVADELEVQESAPEAQPPPPERGPRAPARRIKAPAPAPAPAPVPAPAPAPEPRRDDLLEAEAQALQQVQAALREKDAARALRLVAEQDRRFPDGQLKPERQAARVLALCASDPAAGATALAQFVAAHGGSPLLGRLKAACAK